MVVYVAGIEKVKIERLDGLRSKYPFLEQIIAEQAFPIFDIEEAILDESVLAHKCHEHDSQGPEAFGEHTYAVTGNDVLELAVLYIVPTKAKIDKKPSPLVREELLSEGITPDFLVKVRHLKYEIEGEHRNDVTLIVYRPK